MGTDVQERVRRPARPAERYSLPAHCDLPPEAISVGEARRFVRAVFDDNPNLLSPGAEDDAIICVSELATNAVLHAKTGFRITVTRTDGSLAFGVEDAVTDRWPIHQAAEVLVTEAVTGVLADVDALLKLWGGGAEDRRGIYLVAALAHGWGIVFSKKSGKKIVYMVFDMQGESFEEPGVPAQRH